MLTRTFEEATTDRAPLVWLPRLARLVVDGAGTLVVVTGAGVGGGVLELALRASLRS